MSSIKETVVRIMFGLRWTKYIYLTKTNECETRLSEVINKKTNSDTRTEIGLDVLGKKWRKDQSDREVRVTEWTKDWVVDISY